MTVKARAIRTLYRAKRITLDGMKQAVEDGIITKAEYTVITGKAHTGSESDPIPYDGNMELFEGLYYIQNGVTYRCIRNSEQPVYHALSDLVGLYVEVV